MNKRQCVSCGAPIEPYSHKCSYCGMVYDDGYWTGVIQYVPLHMNRHHLVAQVEIPDDILHSKIDSTYLADYTKKGLTEQLAASLSEMMTIKTSRDLFKNTIIVRGKVWVEEPYGGYI